MARVECGEGVKKFRVGSRAGTEQGQRSIVLRGMSKALAAHNLNTLADDATPAGPGALTRATTSPLPATAVRSAARADRTPGNQDTGE